MTKKARPCVTVDGLSEKQISEIKTMVRLRLFDLMAGHEYVTKIKADSDTLLFGIDTDCYRVTYHDKQGNAFCVFYDTNGVMITRKVDPKLWDEKKTSEMLYDLACSFVDDISEHCRVLFGKRIVKKDADE